MAYVGADDVLERVEPAPSMAHWTLAVMNAGIFSTESQYGGPWFMEALRQVGILLGLTDVNGAPPGSVMGSGGSDPATGAPAESVFPGNADILHGRYLYQPDSNAINMYKFTVTTPGTFSAETIAQRLAPSIARSSGGQATVSASNTSWHVFDTLQICFSGFIIIIASTLLPTTRAA